MTSLATTIAPRRTRLLAAQPAVWALAGATLVGALLRFVTLGDQSFWAEEAVTRSLVARPLWSMLTTIPHSESTPPLYYVLAWLWTRVFGSDEIGLRSLSATAGVLTIPVAYLAARTLIGRTAPAVAVAAFVAVSPIMVWYSQESRSYGTYVLFSALSLLFFARALRSGRRGELWAWSLTAALRIRRGSLLPLASAAGVGAALVPLAKYQHDHISAFQGINSEPLRTRVWEVMQRWPFVSYNPGRDAALAVVWVTIAVLVWRGRRNDGARLAFYLALAAVGLPLVLAAGRTYDVFTFRNVLSGWVPLAIATATAAGLPDGRRLVALVAAGCLVLLAPTFAIASKQTLQRDSWRSAIRVLRSLPPVRRALVSEDYFTPPQYWPQLHLLETQGMVVRELDYVSRYATPATHFESLPDFHRGGFRVVGNLGFLRLEAPRPELVRPASLPPGFRIMRVPS